MSVQDERRLWAISTVSSMGTDSASSDRPLVAKHAATSLIEVGQEAVKRGDQNICVMVIESLEEIGTTSGVKHLTEPFIESARALGEVGCAAISNGWDAAGEKAARSSRNMWDAAMHQTELKNWERALYRPYTRAVANALFDLGAEACGEAKPLYDTCQAAKNGLTDIAKTYGSDFIQDIFKNPLLPPGMPVINRERFWNQICPDLPSDNIGLQA